MADITKCKGEGCPIKDTCKRHTSPEGTWQSWFAEMPFKISEGKFTCDMYWGEQSESVLNQLKSILNNKIR